MEYMVVYDGVYQALVTEVNSLITMGWRPLGGVSVSITETCDVYVQAMIRETETEAAREGE